MIKLAEALPSVGVCQAVSLAGRNERLVDTSAWSVALWVRLKPVEVMGAHWRS